MLLIRLGALQKFLELYWIDFEKYGYRSMEYYKIIFHRANKKINRKRQDKKYIINYKKKKRGKK